MRWSIAWLTVLPLAVLRAGLLAETDTFWQVRTGLLILDQRAIPEVDPFSWTARGEPWTLNSWGFDLIVGVAYRLAGLPGVALTCALAVWVIGGLVLLAAKKLGSLPSMAAATLLLVSPVLIAWLSARPQLVDYVAVLALVLLLRRVVEGRATWLSLLGVGALMTVWVNLHSASLLGVAIVGACAVLLLARRSSRGQGYRCMGATAAAVAGSMANPYGWGLIAQTAGVKNASTDVVVEWQHLDPTSPTQLVMLLIGLAALALAWRRRDEVFVAALSVATVGSLSAIRILPILVLLAVPVIAAALSGRAVADHVHRLRLVLVPGATVAMAALVAVALPSLSHVGRPDPALYPSAAVQQLPKGCRLFTSYQVGGFVLLERPDVPVSIDSRNDLYGAERVATAARALQGQGDVDAALAGAGCVLVPSESGLAHRLAQDPQWRLRFSEPAGALFLRT